MNKLKKSELVDGATLICVETTTRHHPLNSTYIVDGDCSHDSCGFFPSGEIHKEHRTGFFYKFEAMTGEELVCEMYRFRLVALSSLTKREQFLFRLIGKLPCDI